MMTDKYELQEDEEYIDEYIDDEGNHVTILKDKNGEIKHGWTIEIDADVLDLLERAAAVKGQDFQEYIDECMENAILSMIEEAKTRNAIEEISD